MSNTNYELPIDSNWTDGDGCHDGGQSTGVGYTIAWQRGSLLESGRNDAFVIEVLESAFSQIEYFNSGKFTCEENTQALKALRVAIGYLELRRDRRKKQGTLGTTKI